MAIRRKNILGEVSGKIGNSITRIRYGKEVVYSLPDKVKVSNSQGAKTARKKFGLTVNFAKFINSIPDLSGLWSNTNIPGTNSYQRLIKNNAKRTDEKNLTLTNIITPPGTLTAPLSCSFKDNVIRLEIDSSLNDSIPFTVYIVLCFYEPMEMKLNDFTLDYIQNEINETSGVSFILNGTQKMMYETHNHCIIYTALIKFKEKTEWSSTSAFMLK
jgi:hypothetical protein